MAPIKLFHLIYALWQLYSSYCITAPLKALCDGEGIQLKVHMCKINCTFYFLKLEEPQMEFVLYTAVVWL